MSYVEDLIDIDDFQNNIAYVDSKNEDNNVTSNILNDDIWLNEFNTERSNSTKSVSHEEDIISTNGSSSPRHVNGGIKEPYIETWPRENQVSMNNRDLTDKEDGFASTDVLTVGEYHHSPEENQVSSMADHWGNTTYSTVLRTSCIIDLNSSHPKLVNSSISQNRTHQHANAKDSLCTVCRDRVYVTETLLFDKRVYHRKCFKCSICNGILRMNNVTSYSNQLFCNTHYMEVYKQKGKWDDINFHYLSVRSLSAAEPKINQECEELPTLQNMRINVEKFRQLESSCDVEQLKPGTNKTNIRRNNTMPSLGLNLTPVNRLGNDDLCHQATNEMPTPGTTKILLQHWNSIGSGHCRSSTPSGMATKNIPRLNIMNYKPCSPQLSDGASLRRYVIHNDDFIEVINDSKSTGSKHRDVGSYAHINAPSPYNSKIQTGPFPTNERSDIAGTDPTEIEQADELPEEGTIRNLVGFFQALKKT